MVVVVILVVQMRSEYQFPDPIFRGITLEHTLPVGYVETSLKGD